MARKKKEFITNDMQDNTLDSHLTKEILEIPKNLYDTAKNLNYSVKEIEELESEYKKGTVEIIGGQIIKNSPVKQFDKSKEVKLNFPLALTEYLPQELYYRWANESNGEYTSLVEEKGWSPIKITKIAEKRGQMIRIRVGTNKDGHPEHNILIAKRRQNVEEYLASEAKYFAPKKTKKIIEQNNDEFAKLRHDGIEVSQQFIAKSQNGGGYQYQDSNFRTF